MENRLSRKALRLLCSPPSFIAMAALLVNDHLLRRFWPSWITGKLGDFAWLLFFPFALAWGWALLLPRRERLVRGLAFGLTGGIFALANTVPAAHAAVVRAAEWALGQPVIWVRDPSDLIALAALAAAWLMWEKLPDAKTPIASRRNIPAPWNRLALAAAALLTIANSAGPPAIGVEHLAYREGSIYGLERHARQGYVSHDGGFSWTTLKTQYEAGKTAYSEDGKTWISVEELCPACARTEVDLTTRILDVNGAVRYRYASGQPIERSDDGGATWQKAFTRQSSPADKTYYERLHMNYRFYPGPLDAVADPQTGNIVFAMGVEGVLVRTPDDAWTWVEIGLARRAEVRRGEGLWLILQGELLLAAGFGLLAIMTLLARWRRSTARKIFLTLYWILWGLNVVLMPELRTGYGAAMDTMLMVGGCIYLLIHIDIELAMTIPKQATAREIGRVALTGLLVAGVFLIPYVLWVLAIIPWYGLAAGLGVALGIMLMTTLGRGRTQGA
ncbi:MAG TPA: hypothetical protein PKZ84_12715 [Anaerolineae bacterium]|nr:hypothetical protein [Anaerolineae bacterium]HQI85688.1 hypothetical protein [Anaerolineae bacterium]